jgi:hypothetical protein
MDYSAGSRIRVRLYSGKVVEAARLQKRTGGRGHQEIARSDRSIQTGAGGEDTAGAVTQLQSGNQTGVVLLRGRVFFF